MKVLQIALFLIANVVFLTQIGRHAHQVLYGTERSILERYETDFADRQRAREQKDDSVLLEEYRVAHEAVRKLEKGVKQDERGDIRLANEEKYALRDSLGEEIRERERKRREVRDTWLFSGFGIVLILVGGVVYLRGNAWSGLGILISGFVELEYWASPTLFVGAADAEFHTLLINKLVLSIAAFVLLSLFWIVKDRPGTRAG